LGIQQAKALGHKLKSSIWCPAPLALLSSPKERSVQTAEELAVVLGVSLKVTPALDEARSYESVEAFCQRVESFLIEIKAAPPAAVVVLVSHSDWLETAGYELLRSRPDLRWAQAGAHVIEIAGDTATHLAQL